MYRVISGLLLFGALLSPGYSATIAPAFSGSYTLIDLGAAPSVPTNYGGLIFKAGNPNVLLLGGAANGAAGVIDAVTLTRGAGNHVTGFSGSSQYSTAPNIDGGLIYAPNGDLLFTEYSNNQIGELKPGSTTPDKTVNAPVTSSVGSLQIVPAGFNGAGNYIFASYSTSQFCVAPVTSDGTGTYNVGSCGPTVAGTSGPEGLIYVPMGSPVFSGQSMLISEYSANRVSVYSLDANGLPNQASRQDFITGLSGAEGAAIDPLTGDFFFSTFGSTNHVYEIQGFAVPVTGTPEPFTGLFAGGGLCVLALLKRRFAR